MKYFFHELIVWTMSIFIVVGGLLFMCIGLGSLIYFIAYLLAGA